MIPIELRTSQQLRYLTFLRGGKPRSLDGYQKRREVIQMRLETPFRRELRILFLKQGALLVARIRKLKGIRFEATRIIQPGEDSIISIKTQDVLKRTRPQMERIFRAQISKAIGKSKTINQGLVQVNAVVDFTLFQKRALEFLEHHVPMISGDIEETTLKKVSRLTGKAIEKGQTADEFALDIRKLFSGMSKTRAKTIAQTEIGMAQGVGDFMAANSTNLDLMKIWSNSKDDKVRPSHQIREKREAQERFSNGLLFPLEPGAPASEVVRCRCTTLWIPRNEADSWLNQ